MEKEARGLASEERRNFRRAKAKPLFDDLESWLEAQLPKLSGKTALAGAIRHALTRLPKARPHLADGRLEIDNNAVELAAAGGLGPQELAIRRLRRRCFILLIPSCD